jgi:hypothetical protein
MRSNLASVEFVVAAVALVNGLWLAFPYWDFAWRVSALVGGGGFQIVVSVVLIATSLIHVLCMRSGRARVVTMLALFVAMVFLTVLAVMVTGFTSVIWTPYLGLTLLAGLAHLSLAMGDVDE